MGEMKLKCFCARKSMCMLIVILSCWFKMTDCKYIIMTTFPWKTPQSFIMVGCTTCANLPISGAFAAESMSTISHPQSIDLSTYFFNF